jgi:hypothetical protein
VKEALSSLVVGERVLSRCANGLLMAEYALFDPAEVMLSATPSQGTREQGYFTTAGTARERLSAEGITPQLARDTFSALRPRHLRALARAPSVLRAIDRLGAYEAFEGAVFDAKSRTYQGAWLDVAALARACPLRDAALLLQAIHLCQVLDEIADDVPVRLLTVNATGDLRAGERTWTKVHLETARRLPAVLRAMRVPARSKQESADDGEVREDLLRSLRGRSAGSKIAEPRIRSLATLVAKTGSTPPPMASSDDIPAGRGSSPSIERRIAEGVSAGTDPMALFEELRGHTQLLRGEDHLRAVAHFLSGMAERSPSQPELRVLASRAWLAAGEPGHARHLSKQVVDNAVVEDDVRLLALEIIESTDTQAPQDPPTSEAPPIVPMPILMAVPHEHFAPVGASLPPFAPEPAPARGSTRPFMDAAVPKPGAEPAREPATIHGYPEMSEKAEAIQAIPVVIVESRSTPPPRAPLPDPAPAQAIHVAAPAARAAPVYVPAVQITVVPRPPPRVARSEIVESLSLPEGLTEGMLAGGAKPETPDQARIAMTRLSRTLGRDYRLWYGTTLVTNAVAVETMQRHLRRRFDDASSDAQTAKKLETELTRHGALLSEILARSLGGSWVDVSGEHAGHWAMVIYPNVRVWPIGRVYRFFQQGHREADLVAYILDLEGGARNAT